MEIKKLNLRELAEKDKLAELAEKDKIGEMAEKDMKDYYQDFEDEERRP